MDYKLFLEQELTKAAQTAKRYFGKVSGTVKTGDNNQVLTEADLAIGKQIVAAVEATYPDHNIIDEEAGVVDKKSQFTWVIDPIDGTSNFAAGLPHYGIMVGLLDGGTPIAGGTVLPAFDELYLAMKGEGAFCNGQPVKVSAETTLSNALVTYGIDSHQEDPELTRRECAELAEIVLNIRNLRATSSAFDYCMVARGRYGAALTRSSKIWDNVALHVLVEEAGGVWTDYYGKPMDYSDPLGKASQNFTMCAANPTLHEQLQAIIQGSKGD